MPRREPSFLLVLEFGERGAGGVGDHRLFTRQRLLRICRMGHRRHDVQERVHRTIGADRQRDPLVEQRPHRLQPAIRCGPSARRKIGEHEMQRVLHHDDAQRLDARRSDPARACRRARCAAAWRATLRAGRRARARTRRRRSRRRQRHARRAGLRCRRPSRQTARSARSRNSAGRVRTAHRGYGSRMSAKPLDRRAVEDPLHAAHVDQRRRLRRQRRAAVDRLAAALAHRETKYFPAQRRRGLDQVFERSAIGSAFPISCTEVMPKPLASAAKRR